jgi:type I restriction enzyme R subunit
VAVLKLYRNEPLMPTDLGELDRIFAEAGIGAPEEMERIRGEGGLGIFLRSLVGWIAPPRSRRLTPSSEGAS